MLLCVSDSGVDWYLTVVVLDYENFTFVRLCSRSILPYRKSQKRGTRINLFLLAHFLPCHVSGISPVIVASFVEFKLSLALEVFHLDFSISYFKLISVELRLLAMATQ